MCYEATCHSNVKDGFTTSFREVSSGVEELGVCVCVCVSMV